MDNLNINSFRMLVDAVNNLKIPAHALGCIFELIGDYPTETLTTDLVFRAWTVYQQSPAYKSIVSRSGVSRAAS